MELRHLRYFATLAEEQHFGHAARRLNVVQSALSVQIKDLEEEIGTSLFHRTSHRVELTSAGQEFLKHAAAILSRSEEAKHRAIMASRGEIGRVRIGFSASAVLDGKLSAKLHQHHVRFPGICICLQEGSPAEQIRALRDDRLDLCLAPDFGVDGYEDIEALTLRRWPWCLALPETHALAQAKVITPELLRDEVFVQFEIASDNSSLRKLLGFEPQTSDEWTSGRLNHDRFWVCCRFLASLS